MIVAKFTVIINNFIAVARMFYVFFFFSLSTSFQHFWQHHL